MGKELRKAVTKAYNLETMLSGAIQKVESLLVFKGFDIKPQASMCNGGELILEYMGGEISIERAVELMETKGFIEPSDFL